MAEAVDHGGGQQHGHDAQDGHHGENQELGGLGLAVLGGDLFDLVPLQWQTRQRQKGRLKVSKPLPTFPHLWSNSSSQSSPVEVGV